MSNMSYCRFQNTLSDLRECLDALEEGNTIQSREEARAAENLLTLFTEFVSDHHLLNCEMEVEREAIKELVDGSKAIPEGEGPMMSGGVE